MRDSGYAPTTSNQRTRGEEGYGQRWRLVLQWCRYFYDHGSMEHDYRFIWVTPEGKLQPARGQARLPSLKIAQELMAKAKAQGGAITMPKLLMLPRGRALLASLEL